jgi:hypothetical protein
MFSKAQNTKNTPPPPPKKKKKHKNRINNFYSMKEYHKQVHRLKPLVIDRWEPQTPQHATQKDRKASPLKEIILEQLL